ncbi:MAG: 5-formyltetrahydrofolate cyclo-ligase [Spartobacteria bacterium]|nr:5-formyltetrahydrofolate cyclo-ligase [Spartobacteria bacterium]
MITKDKLRQILKARLRAMDSAQRIAMSHCLAEHVISSSFFSDAQTIGLYLPLPSEVDVTLLCAQEKKWVVPARLPHDVLYQWVAYHPDMELEKGPDKVLQPVRQVVVKPETIDTVLVPGLGFSERGERLGRGGGFYDRLLAATSGLKVGVAYECQIMSVLPVENHDIMMDCVATNLKTRYTY